MPTRRPHAPSRAAGPIGRRRAIVLLIVLSLGCHRAREEGDDLAAANAAKPVRCAAARSLALQDTLEIQGTIAPLPDRDAQIAAQVAGRLLRVLVREGDRVQREQPLAQIDAAGLRDQSQQAAAQLAKARAESTLAGSSRDRTQRVFERGIAARQELDEAVARLSTAQAAEAEARASAQIINRQLDRATVRAPLSGTVLRVFRKTGELVDGTGATPIVEVGDPSRLELVGTAPAAGLVQCKVGASAAIEVPAMPGSRLTGVVAAVSPAVDRVTGLGVVRISLTFGKDTAPPVGVTATARVVVGRSRMAVVVPSQALRAAIGTRAEVVICGPDKRAHVLAVMRGVAVDAGTELRPIADHGDGERDGGGTPIVPGALVAVDPVLGIADGDLLDVH